MVYLYSFVVIVLWDTVLKGSMTKRFIECGIAFG